MTRRGVGAAAPAPDYARATPGELTLNHGSPRCPQFPPCWNGLPADQHPGFVNLTGDPVLAAVPGIADFVVRPDAIMAEEMTRPGSGIPEIYATWQARGLLPAEQGGNRFTGYLALAGHQSGLMTRPDAEDLWERIGNAIRRSLLIHAHRLAADEPLADTNDR